MPRKARGERPLRGGSDSARARGLTGIVVHVTPQERRLLGTASEHAGIPHVKEYVRRAALAAAREEIRKISPECLDQSE
jgi:hypothetical protein